MHVRALRQPNRQQQVPSHPGGQGCGGAGLELVGGKRAVPCMLPGVLDKRHPRESPDPGQAADWQREAMHVRALRKANRHQKVPSNPGGQGCRGPGLELVGGKRALRSMSLAEFILPVLIVFLLTFLNWRDIWLTISIIVIIIILPIVAYTFIRDVKLDTREEGNELNNSKEI